MKPQKKTPLTELKELRKRCAELTAARTTTARKLEANATRIAALEEAVEYWKQRHAEGVKVQADLARSIRCLAEELGRVDP